MNWLTLRRVAGDLIRVNARYLVDVGQRSRMRDVLRRDGFTPQQQRFVAAEFAAAPASARPYAGLAATSLTLAGVRVSDAAPAHLNLLIGEVREGGVFAGIHTALTAAAMLAARLQLPLRVVMLDFTSAGNNRAAAERFIRERFDVAEVTVIPRETLRGSGFGSRDFWLATHWKTAHAVQVACEIGLVGRTRVAYLIQDYEPGFSPWSTESVLAASTYHAEFIPLVNSTPLWRFLSDQEHLTIDRTQVFAPDFDEERLRETAQARTRSDIVKVLFYGRPSKHRNLFRLGVSALSATAAGLGDDTAVQFFSAGEPHDDIDLGGGHTLMSLGRLAWDDYFAFLSSVSVVLTLQQSPHPSHPPFDAAISGAIAITNDFHQTRGSLHPRIHAVPASTVDLAGALCAAIRQSAGATPSEYLPVEDGLLGGRLTDAVDAVASWLNSRRP